MNDKKRRTYNPGSVMEQFFSLGMPSIPDRLTIVNYSGLRLAEVAKDFDFIIRGIRSSADIEYELKLAKYLRHFGIKTVFIPTSCDVSSSEMKQLQLDGALEYFNACVPNANKLKLL